MEKTYLCAKEAAALLGVSLQFIWTEIYKHKVLGYGIPYLKMGPKLLRFDREALLTWAHKTRAEEPYYRINDVVKMKRERAAAAK